LRAGYGPSPKEGEEKVKIIRTGEKECGLMLEEGSKKGKVTAKEVGRAVWALKGWPLLLSTKKKRESGRTVSRQAEEV